MADDASKSDSGATKKLLSWLGALTGFLVAAVAVSQELRIWIFGDGSRTAQAVRQDPNSTPPNSTPPKPPAPPPPPASSETEIVVRQGKGGSTEISTTGPAKFSIDRSSGEVHITVPTPPPPPPPPPAYVPPDLTPTPPPPPAACIAGPFMAFFNWDEDDITPQAAAILDNAASAYQTCGQAQVMVAGHADRSGADEYNVGLSQRRAASVRSYLAGRGIPDGVMTTEAFGESRPLVETADGVLEPQNRRAEVTFGPGSGW